MKFSMETLLRRYGHALAAAGVCGSALVGDALAEAAPEARDRLLPNPAFRAVKHGGSVTLVTNAGRKNEARYRLDSASLALWTVLVDSLPRGDRDSIPKPTGLTADEIVKQMQQRFPDKAAKEVERHVRAFLTEALAEGIVLTADSAVKLGDIPGGFYIEYQPKKKRVDAGE